MGFAVTWCAIREEGTEEFLKELGLSATGGMEELPESPISMARLDTGWRVIWCNEYACPFLRPEDLAGLSNSRDVLLCLVEEHVMASSSEMWSGGKRKWWLSHEGEDGPSGLEAGGELPECFAKIRDEMEKAQQAEGGDDADVDYIFEIPLRVAQQLVGFKHDEHCPHIVNNQFAVLSRSTQKRTFFSKLLGK
jgi:hypothetical protein